MPLHGDRGGPIYCMTCSTEWHGRYNRQRKLGRIVVKAIKAYSAAGGDWSAIDRLKLAASGFVQFADTADTIGADVGDITKELLEDAIRLTHPDRHPPERQELAQRVTQELIAMKPFVFPAPPTRLAPVRDTSTVCPPRTTVEPLRIEYPCETCVDQVPYYYCNSCRTEWARRRSAEGEAARARRRKRDARARAVKRALRQPTWCAGCRKLITDKRRDAKFCCAACRQSAHRHRVTESTLPSSEQRDSRHAEAAP